MLINYISDLNDFLKDSKVILCDLWGVIHNGKEVFPDSLNFLECMMNNGVKVIFISNAPRPSSVVRQGLIDKLNLSENLFHSIISSGDIAIKMINKLDHGKKYFHMGPEKDQDLLLDIKIQQVENLNDSDFVLCTGFDNDELEAPNDYRDILQEMIQLELPMICANPDLIVFRGEKKIFCAGSLAELYSDLGGKVKSYGKPFQEIYNYAFHSVVSENLVEDKSQIVAIGDSIRTDIKGALKFGINSIFVETGIHKNEINDRGDVETIFNIYLGQINAQVNIVKSLKL